MTFSDILSSLAAPQEDQPATRRETINKAASFARKLAMVSVPAALSTIAFPAKAASPDALNLMLEFKLMMRELYAQGADATFSGSAQGAIGAADVKKVIAEILPHTDRQIAYLSQAVVDSGGGPITRQFVFPATTFTDRSLFMAIAQVLHDLSSRTIKGQLQVLEGSEYQMEAIKIQAADARFATLWSISRRTNLLQFYVAEDTDYSVLPQTLTDFGNGNGVDIRQTVYQGESNTLQAGTDLVSASATDPLLIAGAFDEPISETEARKVLNLFEA